MYPGQVNSPVTELSAAINNVVTTIALLDASILPVAPNLAVIGQGDTAETILYTGKAGNNLTGVTRGFQGTARAWNAGIKVARYFTAYDYDTLRGNIGDHETRLAAAESDIGTKQPTITGAATTIDTENLTASRALVSDATGKVAVSAVTAVELGYVDGVTSAIQTQLDTKLTISAQLNNVRTLSMGGMV